MATEEYKRCAAYEQARRDINREYWAVVRKLEDVRERQLDELHAEYVKAGEVRMLDAILREDAMARAMLKAA